METYKSRQDHVPNNRMLRAILLQSPGKGSTPESKLRNEHGDEEGGGGSYSESTTLAG